MIEIQRSKGIVKLDLEDAWILDEYYVWTCINKYTKGAYASCMHKKTRKTFLLHRIVLSAPKGLEIDHINNNGYDNRKSNLRICSHKDNHKNRRGDKKSSSKYKGVSYCKKDKVFRARIWVDGKEIGLGRYKKEEDAAKAYNKGASIYFKEYAYLNVLK